MSIEGALIFDVTSHQGRFYAAGARVEPPYEAFPTVWSSDDGSAWIATELPGRGVPERIAVSGDGTIMAAGRATMEGVASPGFWVEQGDGWRVLLGPADHRGSKPFIFDLLGTPEAFVLIISDGGSRDDPRTIHVSGADLEWRATGIADNVRVLGQLQGDVVATGQGRMCRSQAASVWTCSDLPEMDYLVPQALVEHDGRLVAVTQVLNENTTDIEVWVDRP